MDIKKYKQKLKEEIGVYKNKVNIHELPDIFHYWSNKYLLPLIQSYGFDSINDIYIYHATMICNRDKKRIFRLVSIGAGNCENEIEIAVALTEKGITNFEFTCLDINDQMLDRGKRLAIKRGVEDNLRFDNVDLNNWKVEIPFDIIFAELEDIFQNIHSNLNEEGYFIFHDMFGRNGHMRWPEAREIVDSLWSELGDNYKYNHQLSRMEKEFLDWDCSNEGFEGIRAQDILPLLTRDFKTEMFIYWGGIIDVFIDRGFGYNYSTSNNNDLAFIDKVEFQNRDALLTKRITPTQGIAVLTKNEPLRRFCLYGRSISDCIRITD